MYFVKAMEIRNTYFHNPVGAISIKEKLVLLNVKKIVPNIHGTPSEMTHSHWLPREGHCVKKKNYSTVRSKLLSGDTRDFNVLEIAAITI